MSLKSAGMPVLPRYSGTDPVLKAWADQVSNVLELWMRNATAPAGGDRWAVSGVVANRTFNATGATLPQVAQAVGTLLTDLESGGSITQ